MKRLLWPIARQVPARGHLEAVRTRARLHPANAGATTCGTQYLAAPNSRCRSKPLETRPPSDRHTQDTNRYSFATIDSLGCKLDLNRSVAPPRRRKRLKVRGQGSGAPQPASSLLGQGRPALPILLQGMLPFPQGNGIRTGRGVGDCELRQREEHSSGRSTLSGVESSFRVKVCSATP